MKVMATRAVIALTKVPGSIQELESIIEGVIAKNKPQAEGYSYEFIDELPDDVPVHAVDQLLKAKEDIGESAVFLAIYML